MKFLVELEAADVANNDAGVVMNTISARLNSGLLGIDTGDRLIFTQLTVRSVKRVSGPFPLLPLAFEVSIHETTCIVFATTAKKAQWVAVKAYREANPRSRDKKEWAYTRCGRRKDLDNSPLRSEPARCWTEEQVAQSLQSIQGGAA